MVEGTPKERLCAAAIEGVLSQYGCDLVGKPFLTPDGRIDCAIAIVAKVKEVKDVGPDKVRS